MERLERHVYLLSPSIADRKLVSKLVERAAQCAGYRDSG